MIKFLKNKKFSSYFCKSCSIQSVESIEDEINRKMFPRICIGHIGMVIVGIVIVITELTR